MISISKEQTPELCLLAVQQDGLALQYVKEQTESICLAAVKQNGWALEFVKEQNPTICILAMQYDIHTVMYINNLGLYRQLGFIYLPSNEYHRQLILLLVDGKYKCWIGCQANISVEELIWRIHHTDGGLKLNPHRKYYIDFLKEKNLYNVAS